MHEPFSITGVYGYYIDYVSSVNFHTHQHTPTACKTQQIQNYT